MPRCRGVCLRSSFGSGRNSPVPCCFPARAKQDFVDLANEAGRQRKAFPYPFQSVIEGRDIIGNVLDVFDGTAGNFLVFRKVGDRREMTVSPRSAMTTRPLFGHRRIYRG